MSQQIVDDLRQRLQLLQKDRRANVDLIETTKVNNAEEIGKLREENKELKSKLTKLHKTFTFSKHQGKDELSTLRKEVLKRRAEYDSLKVTSAKRRRELMKLGDEAKACELEAGTGMGEGVAPHSPNTSSTGRDGDASLTRQIRSLESKLDKAMIKYNEAQSIRSTYEHIVKRLKEERIGFDNQLTALERTVQAKQRDYEELLLLSGDASHARDIAQQQLHTHRCQYEEKRLAREGELREKHQMIKVRKQMIERQRKKDEEKQKKQNEQDKQVVAAAQALNGAGGIGGAGLGRSSSFRNRRASMMRRGSVMGGQETHVDRLQEEQEEKIDVYEQAFRRIRDATGVGGVNEVIEKIVGQEGTTDNLVALSKKNQERIEQMARRRDELKTSVEDLQYSGSNSPHRRKAVDDKEKRLNESISSLTRYRDKHDRYVSSLFSVKAGIKHLQDKLEPARRELNAGSRLALPDVMSSSTTTSSSSTPSSSSPNSALPDVIWSIGDVLVEIMARIREREITGGLDMGSRSTTIGSHHPRSSLGSSGGGDECGDGEGGHQSTTSFASIGSARSACRSTADEDETGTPEDDDGRPYNQRIVLPSAKDDLYETNNTTGLDDGYGDLEEEELSRERVKKASTSIVLAVERQKARERRRRS